MRSKNFALSLAERSLLSRKCSSGITGLTSGGRSPSGAAAAEADPPDGAVAEVPSTPTVAGVVPAPEATGVAELASRPDAAAESVEGAATAPALVEEAAGAGEVLQN